jgi:drug/metabolite transporter (DMT)-like permease
LATPAAGLAWLLTGRPGFPPVVWPLLALSSVAELAYFLFLSEAYRRGDLSAVYPLARGAAPLLAVVGGIVIVGERPTTLEAAGIICLLAGIWIVRRPTAAGKALLPALITAVCIASYSTIDRIGVRLTPPWFYGWAIWVGTALLLLSWQALVRRSAPRADASSWPRAVVVGLLISLTYLMILFALRVAPLSVVAPARESAIVLVTGWGIWRLEERQGVWLKVSGALGIVAGIVLLALQ